MFSGSQRISLFHFLSVECLCNFHLDNITNIILILQWGFVWGLFTFPTIWEKQEAFWLPSLLGPTRLGPQGTSLVVWRGWVWKWSQIRHTQSAGSPGSPWSPPQSGVKKTKCNRICIIHLDMSASLISGLISSLFVPVLLKKEIIWCNQTVIQYLFDDKLLIFLLDNRATGNI